TVWDGASTWFSAFDGINDDTLGNMHGDIEIDVKEKYLRMTKPINSQRTTAFIPDLNPGNPIKNFNASFDLYQGPGSDDPADGVSFYFGPLADTTNLGDNTNTTGIRIHFKIYQNDEIIVRYNNVDVSKTQKHLLVGEFVPVSISVSQSGRLRVMHGSTIIQNQISNWNPAAGWRFALGGRTGGQNALQAVDNLNISVLKSTAQTFQTQQSTKPVVANRPAIDVTGSTATIAANVVAVGTGTVDNGKPPSFSSQSFEGLELWLDGNDLATIAKNTDGTGGQPANNGALKYWADKSGRSNHARMHKDRGSNIPILKENSRNSKHAVEFTNDILIVDNSARFDELSEMTLFVAMKSHNVNNWAPVISKRGESSQGWQFRRRGGDDRMTLTIRGTSGGDDPAANPYATHMNKWRIYAARYDNTSRTQWGNGRKEYSFSDTGVIPTTASKVAIGARDNNGANSISFSGNFTIGELIFYSKGLTNSQVAMIEGYLQDKWQVDGGILQADHKYKTTAPDFSERSNGANLTLYYGISDGGTDTGAWDNKVELGNYYSSIAHDGFLGTGYMRSPDARGSGTSFADQEHFFRVSIEDLKAQPAAGQKIVTSEPGGGGFFFDGDNDFKNVGIGITRNDNYLALFESYITPTQTGAHIFKMDSRDDRQAMWLDLNRNNIFELSEGEKLGNAPWDVNNISVTLEEGKSYRFAMLSGEYGGGSKFRSLITTPTLSQRVIKPTDNAQKGLFTFPLLSNGKEITENLKPEVELTGLVKGANYFYRFMAENTPDGGGAQ
ncbi:MAG: LamG-like jellyroll fold domain-containing protein, partial [Opitutae bacterium]